MATLKNTLIDDTGYLQLPSGTTAQRPSSPSAGYMRYNTTEDYIEVYDGTDWVDVKTTAPAPAISISLWGGAGAGSQSCDGSFGGKGGAGAFLKAQSSSGLTSGTTLYIFVGQGGAKNRTGSTYGGGGPAGGSGGGSGGGSTYIALGTPPTTSNVIAVAAGGVGGNTGDTSGSNGSSGGSAGLGGSGGSGGGTQIAGGAAGTGGFGGGGTSATAGGFLQGGTGMGCKGSGGASGYYGGGGGNGDCGACASGAGGGGSNYIDTSTFDTVLFNDLSSGSALPTSGSTDTDYSSGVAVCPVGGNGGNGYAVIYVNGTKYTYSYTGTVQSLTL